MENAHDGRTTLHAKILKAAKNEPTDAAVARAVGCSRAYVGRVLRAAGVECTGVAMPTEAEDEVPDHAENDAAYLAALQEHHPGGYPSLKVARDRMPDGVRTINPFENDINPRGSAAWPKSESRKVTLAASATAMPLGISRSASPSQSAASGL
jgi:hypothetical protein